MSLLSRVTDFTPGAVVQSQPFDDEFDQLVNLLAGVSQTKSIRILSNDSSFAVARFDQRASTGTPNIIEGYNNGAEVFRLERDGDLVSLGLTGANGIYTFGSIPVFPAINPTAANQGARKQYIDDKKVYNTLVIGYVDDPSTYSLSSNQTPVWPVPPAATAVTLTRFGVLFASGSHTAGGSLTFELVVNGALTGVQIQLNNTNGSVQTPYFNDMADITTATSVWFQLVARSGSITERAVSVYVEYFQKLT